ncbi:MAG: hypothetical protein WC248_03010 [Candidatus Methanomethylophilaceae archaeon]|jgi:hypothetical protein
MYGALFIVASIMILTVVLLMAVFMWMGYDARSRGVHGKKWVITTLAQNNLGIIDYLGKRKDHPIINDDENMYNITMAGRYKLIVFFIMIIILVGAVGEIWYLFVY